LLEAVQILADELSGRVAEQTGDRDAELASRRIILQDDPHLGAMAIGRWLK